MTMQKMVTTMVLAIMVLFALLGVYGSFMTSYDLPSDEKFSRIDFKINQTFNELSDSSQNSYQKQTNTTETSATGSSDVGVLNSWKAAKIILTRMPELSSEVITTVASDIPGWPQWLSPALFLLIILSIVFAIILYFKPGGGSW